MQADMSSSLPPTESDASSLSDPSRVVVTHLSWDAEVDFDSKIIHATATYDYEIKKWSSDGYDVGGGGSAPELWLDTRGLTIESVTATATATATAEEVNNTGPLSPRPPAAAATSCGWTLEDPPNGGTKPHLGRRLVVPLPNRSPSVSSSSLSTAGGRVSVTYRTSPVPSECTAAQWLPPSQTSGKVRPYLFTQCQAIHARSIVPCMDRPGVKFTYDARVTVPDWAVAVMSALPKDGGGGGGGGGIGKNVFGFAQPVPIPSYLLALAVGNLSYRDLSPRCRVYSEPEVVDAAAHEFAQTETFLRAAEDLTSIPYPWGRYDLLCLPPSFPYGGMENPCLTFVTPTLLAGDRSLADVVAHEISHSWTGNLVTNATWGHFWLNEGWTIWLQRKIMTHPDVMREGASSTAAATEGRTALSPEGVFGLDALGGWKHLADDVALHRPEDTKLVLALGDGDPDDSYSSVPYEKGFNLLHALERIVGSESFLNFAKSYIAKFQYGTATSEQFRSYFVEYYSDEKEGRRLSVEGDLAKFDWDAWLYGTGMPPHDYDPGFDTSLAEDAEALAAAWMQYDDDASSAPFPGGGGGDDDLSGWSTSQRTWFLDVLLASVERKRTKEEARPGAASGSRPLSAATISAMSERYGFLTTKNAEVLFRFLLLAIPSFSSDAAVAATAAAASEEAKSVRDEVIETTIRFVTSQGRMKYVRPLYRALRDAGPDARSLAKSTFLRHREFYHPIAAKMVAADLTAIGKEAIGADAEETKNNDVGNASGVRGRKVAIVLAAVIAGVTLVALTTTRGRKR